MFYNDKVIYSVKTQHILIINTINLRTCLKNWPDDGTMNGNMSTSL